jgi:hypothetical protein
MISEKERKIRKCKKELNSLKNKLSGYNLIWFESLSNKNKYDFLFEWKRFKYYNNLEKPEVIYVKRGINKKKFINYPANLKHFIKDRIGRGKWSVSISKLRETSINLLLKNG